MPPGGDGYYYFFSVFFLLTLMNWLILIFKSMDKYSALHRRINEIHRMMKDKQCVVLLLMPPKVGKVRFAAEMR